MNMLASVEVTSTLKRLIEKYNIALQVWPRYTFDEGQRYQVGFEVELIGSHSLDPNHVYPSCTKCCRTRAALLLIAELVVEPAMALKECPLPCEIYSHPTSILWWPRYGNRSAVNISIKIGFVSDPEARVGKRELGVLNEVRHRLAELGAREL